jgi:hypothetical protein
MATKAKVQNSDRWAAREFWQGLAPSFHIEDREYLGATTLFDVEQQFGEGLHRLLLSEGYFQLPPPAWDLPIDEMAALVAALDAQGIPLPFAFMYDEFWLLFMKLGRLLETQLGPDFRMLPDFWVWLIDPKRDESGWSPHRDKDYRSLREDGTPKSLSVWIPLSDANLLNGCMYLVPADRDPTYGTANDREWKFAYPDVRAVPAAAGSILVWSQALLHWGSHGSPRETRPRISAAFEFQAGDVPPFNEPLMAPNLVPEFPARVRLVAKQILQYRHMYALTPEVQAIAESLLTQS